MKGEALLRMAYLFVLQVFQGNTNQSTVVTNKLRQPILAQYIRVHAQQWYLGVCLRIEVYGCAAVSPIPFTPTVLITPICSEFRLVSIIELFIKVSIFSRSHLWNRWLFARTLRISHLFLVATIDAGKWSTPRRC